MVLLPKGLRGSLRFLSRLLQRYSRDFFGFRLADFLLTKVLFPFLSPSLIFNIALKHSVDFLNHCVQWMYSSQDNWTSGGTCVLMFLLIPCFPCNFWYNKLSDLAPDFLATVLALKETSAWLILFEPTLSHNAVLKQ